VEKISRIGNVAKCNSEISWCGAYLTSTLAIMPGKLKPESLLRIRNLLHGGYGHLELAIAKSADPDSWDCTEPFIIITRRFRFDMDSVFSPDITSKLLNQAF
jgi:hypothetical protein